MLTKNNTYETRIAADHFNTSETNSCFFTLMDERSSRVQGQSAIVPKSECNNAKISVQSCQSQSAIMSRSQCHKVKVRMQ